ncbi:acyl-CoA dehydrogenase family protein [Streptosporangium sp. NPDC051023]|uniref:acyl-CoA dehydrogenase family protein n=1 Tax=Streptosporangium sp. NPDC051023 TaxID=3155410 RepID=UPI00345099ED
MWLGPALDTDQQAIAEMIEAVVTSKSHALGSAEDDVRPKIDTLAELGLWTVGASESVGGGGADALTTAVVLVCLGRHWPSLGWASVQAQIAAEILGHDGRFGDLVAGVNAGSDAVAVVDSAAAHVHLEIDGTDCSGVVDRVDAAGARPSLLVLHGPDRAILVRDDSILSRPVRCTGFAGAETRALQVTASGSAVEITDIDADRFRARLLAGAAALASGIATAAAAAASAYCDSREQFGGPLSDLATMRASLTSQRLDAQAATHAVVSLLEGDLGAATAVTRSACEAAVRVGAAALQALGGYGYLTEYLVEQHLRDAISLQAVADVHGMTSRLREPANTPARGGSTVRHV